MFPSKSSWGNSKPPFGAQIDWGDPINTGLRLRYIENEGSGKLLSDLVTKTIATHQSSSGWTVGEFGPKMKLNTISDRAEGTDNVVMGTSAVSMAFWMRWSTRSIFAPLVTKSTNVNNASIWDWGVCFENGTSDPAQVIIVRNGTALSSVGSIAANTTYFIVATVSDVRSQLFVNGVLVATGSGAGAGDTSNTAGRFVQIGGLDIYGITGWVDNVSVLNRELKPSEVIRLYNEPFAGIYSAPVRRFVASGSAPPPTLYSSQMVKQYYVMP